MRLCLPSRFSFKLCIFLNYSLIISYMYIMYLDHIQPEVFGPVPLFPHLKNNPLCPVSAVCMHTVWGSLPEHRQRTRKWLPSPTDVIARTGASSAPFLSTLECSPTWSSADNYSDCGVTGAAGVPQSKVTCYSVSPLSQLFHSFCPFFSDNSLNFCWKT